jgi:hypothetical protein
MSVSNPIGGCEPPAMGALADAYTRADEVSAQQMRTPVLTRQCTADAYTRADEASTHALPYHIERERAQRQC